MSKLCSLAFALLLVAPAAAQKSVKPVRLTRPAQRKPLSQEQLIARRAAKLAEPWLQKAQWTTDYDVARKRARTEKKLIFAYFTRSYAP